MAVLPALLLPFFKDHHLSQITVAEVDRYRQQKVREAAQITAAAENGKPMTVSYVDRRGRSYRRRARALSPRSINMHIDLLAQILAVAVDHGHIPTNPAVGKRRRLKVSKRRPVHLDNAEQIAILLEAAGELDRGDQRGDLMMERIPDLPDNVLGFRASGAVSGGDYESVVVPAIDAASKANDTLRLLYVIPNDCTGFSAESMWDDTKVVVGHVKQLEKVALVSDQEWLRDSIRLLGHLVPGELKAFPMEEEAAAGAWAAT